LAQAPGGHLRSQPDKTLWTRTCGLPNMRGSRERLPRRESFCSGTRATSCLSIRHRFIQSLSSWEARPPPALRDSRLNPGPLLVSGTGAIPQNYLGQTWLVHPGVSRLWRLSPKPLLFRNVSIPSAIPCITLCHESAVNGTSNRSAKRRRPCSDTRIR
jgi:hypothetical protein